MTDIDLALEQVIGACCVELFAAYGVDVTRTAERSDGGELLLCGILGFTGDALRGAIILAAGEGPFSRSNPLPGSPSRNWCAELTNQLVGRIKNALLARGVEIHLSTPVVLRGAHLAPLPRRELPPLSFWTGGELICVWTELEYEPGLVLHEPIGGMAQEGDAFLF